MKALQNLRLHREPAYYIPDRHLQVDALHEALWRRATHRNRTVVNVQVLADQFDVNYKIAHHAIQVMTEAGRIRPLKGSGAKTYVIADPATWRADDPATHVRPPNRSTITWS